MRIRHSTERDLNRIMEIYCFAGKYTAEHGNPNQWGPTNRPPEELIRRDISGGNSYVCVNDEGTVIGTPFESMDLKAGGEEYLRRGGLDEEQIAKIEAYLIG